MNLADKIVRCLTIFAYICIFIAGIWFVANPLYAHLEVEKELEILKTRLLRAEVLTIKAKQAAEKTRRMVDEL